MGEAVGVTVRVFVGVLVGVFVGVRVDVGVKVFVGIRVGLTTVFLVGPVIGMIASGVGRRDSEYNAFTARYALTATTTPMMVVFNRNLRPYLEKTVYQVAVHCHCSRMRAE